jgi:recombination protein RecR
LLGRLPGVGERSAQRLALHILSQPPTYAEALSHALAGLHAGVGFCQQCHHLATSRLCVVCGDPRRDARTICVVEGIADLLALERSGEFHGLYHVLGGVLSPLRGVGPRDLHIDDLLTRLTQDGVEEVILATSISVEGEATASYLHGLLRGRSVRTSRIASGVPQGTDLQYLDHATLGRALKARQTLN